MDSELLSQFFDGPTASPADCRAGMEAARRVRAMVDAREAEYVAALQRHSAESPAVFPEGIIAEVNQTGLGAASRLTARADTLTAMPELGEALAAGDTTGGHIDVVARELRSLTPAQRDAVAEQADRLALEAARRTKREYEQLVKGLVAAVTGDDGLDRLARQRRRTRLTFRPEADGMWRLSGVFDPERAATLHARLVAERERRFHDRLPEDAPADPFERQDHLYALALLGLVDGSSPASGASGGAASGADITVLIDARTLLEGRYDGSVCEVLPGGFDLPIETIRRWACQATVTPVVVHPDGTSLWAGRTQRTATAAQRRVLKVWFDTCTTCDTPFEHTQIHHVEWFRDGGRTDIDNMRPLCNACHHMVHEGGWRLTLHPDGSLTVTRPDGTITEHPPPRARAA